MRSTITRVRGFVEYIASIEGIKAPKAHYSLSILSTWERAKAPAGERRVVQLNLDADGLRLLGARRDLIETEVSR